MLAVVASFVHIRFGQGCFHKKKSQGAVASFVHGGSSMLAVVVCMATFVPYIPKLVDAVPKLMLHFFV
jgi:hypothetical protein